MATGNQGQGKRPGEGRDRNNGGAQRKEQPAPNPAPAGGVEAVTDRLREGYDSTREEMARRYRRAEGKIARNPTSAVLIGFGVGFGLGLALTAMLARDEETWADRYMPDSLRHLPESFQRMRRRMPEPHVPASLNDSFHRLAESISDLPAAIAKMMPGR